MKHSLSALLIVMSIMLESLQANINVENQLLKKDKIKFNKQLKVQFIASNPEYKSDNTNAPPQKKDNLKLISRYKRTTSPEITSPRIDGNNKRLMQSPFRRKGAGLRMGASSIYPRSFGPMKRVVSRGDIHARDGSHGGGFGGSDHGFGHGHGGGYDHDIGHGGGHGHDSGHGGGYGHDSGHGGGHGHDSGHGGGYGHDSGHGGGHGHDSGHGGGYGHDIGHGGGYGHDSVHGGGYGQDKKTIHKPAPYKGPSYDAYDFLPVGKAHFSKKGKFGADPVKESEKRGYSQKYEYPIKHFGGFGGGGSSKGHKGGYGKGHDKGHGGYGKGHDTGHGGYGKGHDKGHGGYGKEHGQGHGGYDKGHGGYAKGHDQGHGGYGKGPVHGYGKENLNQDRYTQETHHEGYGANDFTLVENQHENHNYGSEVSANTPKTFNSHEIGSLGFMKDGFSTHWTPFGLTEEKDESSLPPIYIPQKIKEHSSSNPHFEPWATVKTEEDSHKHIYQADTLNIETAGGESEKGLHGDNPDIDIFSMLNGDPYKSQVAESKINQQKIIKI